MLRLPFLYFIAGKKNNFEAFNFAFFNASNNNKGLKINNYSLMISNFQLKNTIKVKKLILSAFSIDPQFFILHLKNFS